VVFGQLERNLPPQTPEAIRAIHRQFDNKLASLIEDGIKTGEFKKH